MSGIEAQTEAERILNQAHQRAEEIVARAQEDARQVLAQAEDRRRVCESATAVIERRYQAIQTAIARVHGTLLAETLRGAA
jgi:cell division septum initiation protein DivIVA